MYIFVYTPIPTLALHLISAFFDTHSTSRKKLTICLHLAVALFVRAALGRFGAVCVVCRTVCSSTSGFTTIIQM